MLFIGKKSIPILFNEMVHKIRNIKSSYKTSKAFYKTESILVSSILILLLVLFLSLYISNTLHTPLDGTDVLKYGTLGKIFFEEKSLEFRWIRPYPKTGFYFDMNSAPSFALLRTWEKLVDSLFNAEKDLYYKSLGTYYSLLILGLLYFWLSKKSKYLALLGILALLSGFSFFQTMITQHLDSYRIFLLIVSWIFLAYSLEKRDAFSFALLGIFSGFAAFSHTIGGIFAAFNALILFLFLKGSLKYKFTKTCLVISLTIAFGWIHYIIDILLGFGWIFFNRSATFWG